MPTGPRFRIPLGACAVLASTLLGCATGARPRSDPPAPAPGFETARAVVLCETTFEQLRARLGPPSRDGRLGRQRIASWIVTLDPLVRYLGVLLDERGVVTDLYWDVPTEVPWVPTDRCTGAPPDAGRADSAAKG